MKKISAVLCAGCLCLIVGKSWSLEQTAAKLPTAEDLAQKVGLPHAQIVPVPQRISAIAVPHAMGGRTMAITGWSVQEAYDEMQRKQFPPISLSEYLGKWKLVGLAQFDNQDHAGFGKGAINPDGLRKPSFWNAIPEKLSLWKDDPTENLLNASADGRKTMHWIRNTTSELIGHEEVAYQWTSGLTHFLQYNCVKIDRDHLVCWVKEEWLTGGNVFYLKYARTPNY